MAVDRKQVLVDWLHLNEHISLGVDCKKVGVSRTTLRNILEEAELDYPKMPSKRRKPRVFEMVPCVRCGKPSQRCLTYKLTDRKENIIERSGCTWWCDECIKEYDRFLRDRSARE